MSDRFPGGVISATPVTPSGPYGTNTAPGIWTLDQQEQAQKAGNWPVVGGPYDAQFNYVTMLLHGDGTNGGQNNTFLDSSTNNFTITRNGNTTQGSFSPYGSNWSNYFNGTDAYLSVSAQTALSFDGDFTVEAWVNVQTVATSHFPIIDARVTANDNPWALYVINNGATVNLYALYRSGSGMVSTSTVPLNSWVHVAMTRSGSTVRMFINGVTDATTGTNASTMSAGTTQFIGRSKAGEYGTGYISSLRVVKGTALYTSNFTPSTTPLTAVSGTSLLTCQSNRFIDNSSNAFALTVNGTPSVQRFSPFAPSAAYSTATIGGSGYFDGSGDFLTAPDSAAFSIAGGNWTLECWHYPTLLSGYRTMITRRSAIWEIGTSGSNFYWYNGSVYTTTATLTLNAWNHVAVTWDGTNIRMYVNGVLDRTIASANAGTGTSVVWVGTSDGAGAQPLAGYLTDLRVVKGTALYTGSTYTVPTAPLTAVTNTQLLLSTENAAIFDNAMMNDLETVGNAQISTSVKKYGTGSLAFDGTGDYLLAAASPDNRINTTGNFTIEFWAYFNSVAADQRLIGWDNNSSGFVIALYTTSAGGLYYYLSSSGTSWNVASAVSMGSIATNTWYHVAFVRSGSTFTPYINGVAGSATTSSATLTTSTLPLSIGAVGNGASPFNGYIDDLRITNGYARYTANFTPPTAAFPNQ